MTRIGLLLCTNEIGWQISSSGAHLILISKKKTSRITWETSNTFASSILMNRMLSLRETNQSLVAIYLESSLFLATTNRIDRSWWWLSYMYINMLYFIQCVWFRYKNWTMVIVYGMYNMSKRHTISEQTCLSILLWFLNLTSKFLEMSNVSLKGARHFPVFFFEKKTTFFPKDSFEKPLAVRNYTSFFHKPEIYRRIACCSVPDRQEVQSVLRQRMRQCKQCVRLRQSSTGLCCFSVFRAYQDPPVRLVSTD